MYYVYILKSNKDKKFYIGYTRDIKDRLIRHNEGRERSTKNRKPFILKYIRTFERKKEAMTYERYLKSLKSHKYLEKLIVENKIVGR
jgi:putative endonuclease